MFWNPEGNWDTVRNNWAKLTENLNKRRSWLCGSFLAFQLTNGACKKATKTFVSAFHWTLQRCTVVARHVLPQSINLLQWRLFSSAQSIFWLWYNESEELGHFSAKNYGMFVIYQRDCAKWAQSPAWGGGTVKRLLAASVHFYSAAFNKNEMFWSVSVKANWTFSIFFFTS